jgi:hypothetical protein
MTIHQFNTMKWIISEGYVTIKQLEKCHQGNIGSLAKHKFIEQYNKRVSATDSGIKEVERYRYRLQRKHSAQITERVGRLLHLGKILYMRAVA